LPAVTADKAPAAVKSVSMESLTASAPVTEAVVEEEPTVIENEANQEELPLVIDHSKAEDEAKPVKKAAPKKSAAKTARPKGKTE
jgi:hypothetical protein